MRAKADMDRPVDSAVMPVVQNRMVSFRVHRRMSWGSEIYEPDAKDVNNNYISAPRKICEADAKSIASLIEIVD